MAIKTNNPAEYMVESARQHGAAAATVSDGHVLLLTKSFLQELLDKNATQEYVMVFVKRPDFNG